MVLTSGAAAQYQTLPNQIIWKLISKRNRSHLCVLKVTLQVHLRHWKEIKDPFAEALTTLQIAALAIDQGYNQVTGNKW